MEDSEIARRRYGQHQTIFGNIQERNVTFCIDTSGSMYSCLDTIKEQLCFALNQLAANQSSDISFNIIEFSTSVTKWSDKMVKCSEETVSLAKEWVRSLAPKTGTNTSDALLTAFSDERCDAVYLVTDGMPDQHPNEILDDVISVAGNRPVHCFYIQQGMQDGSAVAFLQELAMDTYGSFHVILTTRHGFIDKVTPVYRADMSAERIIRTSSGNIHPANNRVCSLTTTVNDPLPYPYYTAAAQNWFPWQLYPYPFRHYFRHSFPYSMPFGPNMAKMYPYYGWSQFRPAKAWLKHAEAYIDAAGNAATLSSPGPGSLLIGARVLARRQDDGFFYLGTVNSQLLNDKFLVALGPCKHGKYTDTTYEETFIYDIVAYDDALRHTILKGDRVLAPWQPDGERYAPGIVIEGQEKRIAEGGTEDVPLVVTFHDGQTATVPAGKAVWIPRALHERVTLELKLPPGVKRTLTEQSEYPTHNAPGYPSSGPRAEPEQFAVGEPQPTWPSPWLLDGRYRPGYNGGFYSYPPFVPPYAIGSPWPAEGRRIEDMKPIDWSQADEELRRKVASQIAEHESRSWTPPPHYRHHHHVQQNGILTKKDALVSTDDSSVVEQLRQQASKSLRFKDEATEWEAEYAAGNLEMRDSGHESLSDTDQVVSCRYCSEDEGDERGDKPDTRDASVGTHGKNYMRHWPSRSRSAGPRPPWRYWHHDEAPSLRDPIHYGPYAMGPYQESVPPIPLETKQVKSGPQGVEWTAPVNCYVDTSACYKKSPGVMNSQVFLPRPPSVPKQGPGCEPGLAIGNSSLDLIRKQEVAAEYRRREAENRELQWQRAVAERVASRQSVEGQRRLDAQRRLEWEQHRQQADLAKMHEMRETRRALHDEIRMRGVMTQRAEDESRYQREALLQRRADHQSMVQSQQEQAALAAALQRQAAAQERAHARQDAVSRQLAAEEYRQREDAARRREATTVRSSMQRARSAVTARKVDIDVQLRAASRGIHPTMLVH